MVEEYLRERYPDSVAKTRVRLGAVETSRAINPGSSEELAMAGIFRRWADAIVVTPRALVLIEAAIRPDPGDPGKLLLYKSLIPQTPEFQPLLPRLIRMELVVAIYDPDIARQAEGFGIEVVRFLPKGLAGYIASMYVR